MTTAIERLRQLAKAATPGPYRQCGADRGGCQCGYVYAEPLDGALGTSAPAFVFQAACDKSADMVTPSPAAMKANAAFIAAANPAVVLALLSVVEAAAENGMQTIALQEALANLETVLTDK